MHVRVRKRGVKKRGLSGWAAEGGTRARGERRAGVDRAGAPGGRYRVPAVAYSVGRSAAAADIQRVLALRSAVAVRAFSSSFIRPLYRYSCDPISSDCPNCVAFFGARYKHQVEVGGSRTVARLPPPPYFQVHTRGSWVAVHL